MKDKLVLLSELNEKSYNLKPKCVCGNTPEHDLEIQKFIKDKNLDKKLLSNDKSISSSQVIIKELPNNPYCSSITGRYAFDLTQISNFNVYFWKSTDNSSLNPTIQYNLTTPSTISAIDWSNNQKTQCRKALDTFTTFTGTTSTVVNTYASCDIVCVLAPFTNFVGSCYGPYYIKTDPIDVDEKVVYFISSTYLSADNINEGGFMYCTMLHEWGRGFGLAYPYDNGFGSTVMPGVLQNDRYNYQGIGGYIQNNVFNTVMSVNLSQFFLPENVDLYVNEWGYPETLMPLDALALRWLYNVQEVPAPYVSAYGVQLINEGVADIYHSRMIVGKNQNITFGSRCIDIAFYLSNQYFTFNNLNYLRFDYIRNLQNLTSFYTKDIDSTISVLNLENERASIFIENRALTTNLTINLISASINQELFLYIMDSEAKYSITGNIVIRHKATGKTITINNSNSRPVNIYFNEITITRNINNRSIRTIENKTKTVPEVNPTKPKCRCGNTPEHDLEIQKFMETKNLDKKLLSNDKSIAPSQVIIKELPHNPYCSAITGRYAFDLTQITNFNVYFWTSTDNPTLNPEIEYNLTTPSTISAIDWSNNQKTQCKKALDTYTTFTGTTSTVVSNYSECDIVCVIAPFTDFYGTCYGPYYIKTDPVSVDGKVVFLVSSLYINAQNIQEGGFIYEVFIHEWGHGFGLAHPHDNGFDSTVMPAIAFDESFGYPAIAGYIQNTIFNTIMTYVDTHFFLPVDYDLSTNLTGYPQTILPLDALALRWMYDIQEIHALYISTYGINTINPASNQSQSAMIVGKNQTITFGSNNVSVNFYLTNQYFTYYNLQPIKYEYNRPIVKPWAFYPRDLDSTISTINLDNTEEAFIFLENRALSTNLTVNLINNSSQVLNFYCMDCQKNYSISGNVYRNKSTNKTFTIVNSVGATVNVYFDA